MAGSATATMAHLEEETQRLIQAAHIDADPIIAGIGIVSPLVFFCLYYHFSRPGVATKIFKDEKQLATFKRKYNYTISFLSFAVWLPVVAHMYNWASHVPNYTTPNDFFLCIRGDINKLKYTQYPAIAAYTLFFLLKYVEWLDTLFLLIAGKPVSWLAFIHHAITPGIAASTFAQPFGYWGPATNAFVHGWMYLYYNHSKSLRKFKMMLTCLQLAQHFWMMGMITWLYTMCSCPFLPQVLGPFRFSCLWVLVPASGYAFFIVFFLNFFIQTYVLSSNKRRTTATLQGA